MKKFAVAFAVFGFVMPVAYMALDNTPPYVWLSGEIIPNRSKAAAQVSVHWHIAVNRYCPGTIQRQIVDSRKVVHNYDATPTMINKLAHRSPVEDGRDYESTFLLPYDMPVGTAYYRVRTEYYCNPLQYIWPLHATTPELRFEIAQ